MRLQSLALAASACLATIANAQYLRHCTSNDNTTCYSFNIPDQTKASTASNNSSDIYLQIQAPAAMQWVALGQGRVMKDSYMFVIYTDQTGSNVTLSPRYGVGNQEPLMGGPQVFLLEGSGISGGTMTANIRCSNCVHWPGGTLDFKSTSSDWNYASKSGSPLNSNDVTAPIEQHSDYNSFTVDLTQVPGGNSLTPFSQNAPVVSGGSGGVARSSAVPVHGVFMAGVFIIGFPLGAALIRLCSFRGLVWIHAGLQLLSYFGALIGLALGVYVGIKDKNLAEFHPISGIAIVLLLIPQPILGYIHHVQYKHYQSPTVYTTAHVWYGRVILTLGLMEGFLGLRLSRQGTGTQVAYVIIAAIVWLAWVGVAFWGRKKARKGKIERNNIRMTTLQDEGSEEYPPPPRRF